MAETFPTLSVGPKSIQESLVYDPSMRSNAEDGQVISRARHTSTKKKFDIFYDNLTAVDKALLIAMQDTVMVAADTINWTNEDPNDSTVYEVRLEEPIQFNIKPSDYDLWETTFVFLED